MPAKGEHRKREREQQREREKKDRERNIKVFVNRPQKVGTKINHIEREREKDAMQSTEKQRQRKSTNKFRIGSKTRFAPFLQPFFFFVSRLIRFSVCLFYLRMRHLYWGSHEKQDRPLKGEG